jgi:hypothetical protein
MLGETCDWLMDPAAPFLVCAWWLTPTMSLAWFRTSESRHAFCFFLS